jgi:hypothetical protein
LALSSILPELSLDRASTAPRGAARFNRGIGPAPIVGHSPDAPAARARRGTAAGVPVFAWWDYPLFAALTALTVAALAAFLAYWSRPEVWRSAPGPFLLVSLLLLFSGGCSNSAGGRCP